MNSNINRRRVLVTAAAGSAALGAPWLARAQAALKPEYRLSVVGNRPIPISDTAFRWADLIRERSGGRINVKVYPGSQLVGGDQTRELLAMRQGTIDFTVSSTINLSPQVRPMSLFNLPFLMPDSRAFDALITGPVAAELEKAMAAQGVMPLAWGENGFREISNSKRPIRTPADLKGMKIRFAAGNIFADIFNALGANPLQMSFADLQPALTTGAVDGQENPINLYLMFKMDTLAQKHLTVWNYVADAALYHVAKPVWDSFAKADQDMIADTAKEVARQGIAASRKGLGAGGDNSAFDELKKRGVEVQMLTAAEKAEFAKATRAVYDKWVPTVGADLVKMAESAIARRG